MDFIEVMEGWDETGIAPDSLLARFADGSGARPLCAYPQRATHIGGGGDGRDPASFECR